MTSFCEDFLSDQADSILCELSISSVVLAQLSEFDLQVDRLSRIFRTSIDVNADALVNVQTIDLCDNQRICVSHLHER